LIEENEVAWREVNASLLAAFRQVHVMRDVE
jgi:hypothetical protein